MQLKVNILGGDAAADLFEAFADNIVSKVSAAVAKGGMLVEGEAKALCPVDTGNLRQSITSQPSGMRCDIGTNVEYAMYVEFGTYKMAAQPYLVPGLKNKSDEVIELIKDAL
ncbi:MAG: HK97 gp10 family phage protein [Clostridia bacterium]|nr:HK97 gp10 family phage protein [Clostridia bacterium]